MLLTAATATGAAGQIALGAADSRPYDERLMRLSEILGAVHYLRELCGANDGQLWRDRMKELMDTGRLLGAAARQAHSQLQQRLPQLQPDLQQLHALRPDRDQPVPRRGRGDRRRTDEIGALMQLRPYDSRPRYAKINR